MTWVCLFLTRWSRLPRGAGHAQAGPLTEAHAQEPGRCMLRRPEEPSLLPPITSYTTHSPTGLSLPPPGQSASASHLPLGRLLAGALGQVAQCLQPSICSSRLASISRDCHSTEHGLYTAKSYTQGRSWWRGPLPCDNSWKRIHYPHIYF